MEKELVDKVLEKKFIELNFKEKKELEEWCSSEEEFEQLKMVFKGVEQLKVSQTLKPSLETKRSLDNLFSQEHSKVPGTIWYNSILIAIYPSDKPFIRRPIVQLAAIALIVLLAYPFIGSSDLMSKKNELAQLDKTKTSSPAKEQGLATESLNKTNTLTEPIGVNSISETLPFETSVENTFTEETFDLNESVVFASAAAVMPERNDVDMPVSNHPDGIFIGASSVSYSQPASEQPGVLDLLTTTF